MKFLGFQEPVVLTHYLGRKEGLFFLFNII